MHVYVCMYVCMYVCSTLHVYVTSVCVYVIINGGMVSGDELKH